MTATTGTPTPSLSPVAHLEDVLAATPMDSLTYDTLVSLHAEEQAIKARIDELKDSLRASMADRGAQAIVSSDGRVLARISEVNTPRIDTARLKREHPELAKELMIVTSTVRFSVNWPKEEPASAV